MALNIRIAARSDFTSRQLQDMHMLRARVFKDRLGWEVPILSGMEIDGYDALEPLYMMIHDPDDGSLIGCWRLLPTQGPYMLKDSFPALLHGQPVPAHPRIWELSRFAVATGVSGSFGFSAVALESIRAVISYAHDNDIDEYVTVTTIAIERMLVRAGVLTRRIGAPLQVGVEKAVALYVDVAGTHAALCEPELACADSAWLSRGGLPGGRPHGASAAGPRQAAGR